ncbi:MAG: ABC transporter ATP-binding protein [Betaproteobacteria bacterium]|uniref:ABC transporter related protein n=1 Tax=Thiomonas delicata TaxID=364030 RepID=A0A238D1P9_THIDL|nr:MULTISPECIES: ABC transporter ATP-binding protein [Thiomonas]MDE2129928.1 ABC transporter ATP-binding protein [Betaproteobacteria bacterium]OZB43812.1 MAG: ABC transporter ATP-binding protein [Thiomonas sp. 15-66-11]OZB66316.1 MAG: ABC transporter ATP-binding protein [Thiomonas sp. 13-66-29]SBP87175.1 ABC transporter related protein [Thiomonas delicata]
MSSEPLLRLEGVYKRFGGHAVLNDVSFAVGPGEIVGLVGPNGSGKTTTINVISGVHRADAGAVVFDGRPVHKLPTFRLARLGINRTFQVPKVFRDMTVRENIEVAAHFGRAHDADVGAILADIDLAAQADQLAGSLTVNQQKLLDLGRALATGPKLLLVDEIGAGLNPAELGGIATLLQKLAARGIALIVVEHLLDFLNRITARVIVLGAGRMLFEGPLDAASRDPEVVAAFIGG